MLVEWSIFDSDGYADIYHTASPLFQVSATNSNNPKPLFYPNLFAFMLQAIMGQFRQWIQTHHHTHWFFSIINRLYSLNLWWARLEECFFLCLLADNNFLFSSFRRPVRFYHKKCIFVYYLKLFLDDRVSISELRFCSSFGGLLTRVFSVGRKLWLEGSWSWWINRKVTFSVKWCYIFLNKFYSRTSPSSSFQVVLSTC